MDLSMCWKGALLGFSIAAPVGPIGLLCIRRSLSDGRWAGFASGLGAATADSLYGAVAGFGLSAVSAFLVQQAGAMRLVGGVFLLHIGVKTFLAVPPEREAAAGAAGGLWGAYFSTFALTITNPMTILSFVAVFAGLGLMRTQSGPAEAALLVAGVFAGSAAWWLLLSTGTARLGRRLEAGGLRRVNQVSGAVITACAIATLATVLRAALGG